MTNPFDDENSEFLVLINHELQYSLWPTFREIPDGWTAVGPRGNRKTCLDYIEEHWTDMRPKSLVDQNGKGRSRTGQLNILVGSSAFFVIPPSLGEMPRPPIPR